MIGDAQVQSDVANIHCRCFRLVGFARPDATAATTSNVIVADLTPPMCDFSLQPYYVHESGPLLIAWNCSDDESGLRAVSWWLGAAAGSGDVVAPTAASMSATTFADVLGMTCLSRCVVSNLFGVPSCSERVSVGAIFVL